MSAGIPRTTTILTPSGTPASDPTMLVVATASPGTLFHTAVPGTDDVDLVFLLLSSFHTGNLNCNVEVNGNLRGTFTVTRNAAPITIYGGEGFNGGLIIRLWAPTASVIVAQGRIYRVEKGATL